MWRNGGFWLGVILSFLFLLFFFRGVQLAQLKDSLAKANYWFVIPAVLSIFAAIWWRAVRWRFILSPLGRFPPHRLLPPMVASLAINNLVPGRVGLIAQAYLVGERERISKVASGATVITAQVFDGLTLLLIVMIISLLVPLSGWALQVSRGAIALYSLFMFLFFFAAFTPKLIHRLGYLLSRPIPSPWQERVRGWLKLALSGVAAVRNLPRLTLILSTSFLIWAFEAAVFVFLALAFHLELPLYSLLLVTAIVYLSLIIPSLPGGVGPFEYFGKQTLVVLGVNQSLAITFMSILHLTLLLPVTLVGLIFLWLERHLFIRGVRHPIQ